MLIAILKLRLLGWDPWQGAVFIQQIFAFLEALPWAEPQTTQLLTTSSWNFVTVNSHVAKRPSGTTCFLNNKIRQRKLITLKLSKPPNYCRVLDGDRNGWRPSQSSHPSHPHLPPFISLTLELDPCRQCRQSPNSAILAQRHPRSLQDPQTPEHHHRSCVNALSSCGWPWHLCQGSSRASKQIHLVISRRK